jgi:hypothetical protein
MPNFEAPIPPAGQARRLLYSLGVEIAGRLATDFAIRLRGYGGEPATGSADKRIRSAMAAIEDGPVALAAAEPELWHEPLARPARTVAEAAEAVVYALGERIIVAPEPPPPAPRG